MLISPKILFLPVTVPIGYPTVVYHRPGAQYGGECGQREREFGPGDKVMVMGHQLSSRQVQFLGELLARDKDVFSENPGRRTKKKKSSPMTLTPSWERW